jgi:transcriptional regulator with XRE-family HTH domain
VREINELTSGSKIKFQRKKQEISQAALAYGVCSISYLSKIENDKIEPSPEILTLLCKKLNISISQEDEPASLIPQLRDDMERLYTVIKHSGYTEALLMLQDIEGKYKRLTHPSFILVKKLFSLRIAILNKQSDEAKQLYFEIQGLSNYTAHFSNDFYHRFCGLYNYLFGDLELSLKHYKEAEKLSYREDIEEVYYQMGLIYTRLEDIARSTYYTAKALSRYESKMNYRLCKNCNLLLAVNYRKMGENEKALNMYQSILYGLLDNSDNKLRAKVYHNIGYIHFQMGNSNEAIEFYKRSLSYKQETIDPSNTLYLLAKTYLQLKDYEKAREITIEGKKQSCVHENEDYLIKFQVLDYLIEDKEGSPIFEEYMQNTALPFFKEKNDQTTVIEFTQLLAEYFERIYKYKKAYYLLKSLN